MIAFEILGHAFLVAGHLAVILPLVRLVRGIR